MSGTDLGQRLADAFAAAMGAPDAGPFQRHIDALYATRTDPLRHLEALAALVDDLRPSPALPRREWGETLAAVEGYIATLTAGFRQALDADG